MPTIHVRLLSGRTDEQKQEFEQRVYDAAVEVLRAEPSSIKVEFEEIERKTTGA